MEDRPVEKKMQCSKCGDPLDLEMERDIGICVECMAKPKKPCLKYSVAIEDEPLSLINKVNQALYHLSNCSLAGGVHTCWIGNSLKWIQAITYTEEGK